MQENVTKAAVLQAVQNLANQVNAYAVTATPSQYEPLSKALEACARAYALVTGTDAPKK